VIHHWDTDGISSAAILAEALKDVPVQNFTPPIGEYAVAESEISERGRFKSIIIADLCLPRENILKIKETTKAELTVFDHHVQEDIPDIAHINPAHLGRRRGDWPSTTWVLHKFLSLKLCLPTVLGLIGDMEEKVKETEMFHDVQRYMDEGGLTFEDLLTLTELIDSNYRVSDRSGVEEAVRELLKHWNDPKSLMRKEKWRRNVEELKAEIDAQLNPPWKDENGVLIHRMSSKYNIISKVARKLAWEGVERKLVIVVNDDPTGRKSRIYIRGKHLEPHKLVGFARSHGYSAGGKIGVVGVVLPKGEVEAFISEAVRLVRVK
jgi:hypothetical protein